METFLMTFFKHLVESSFMFLCKTMLKLLCKSLFKYPTQTHFKSRFKQVPETPNQSLNSAAPCKCCMIQDNVVFLLAFSCCSCNCCCCCTLRCYWFNFCCCLLNDCLDLVIVMWILSRGLLVALAIFTTGSGLHAFCFTVLLLVSIVVVVAILRVIGWRQDIDIVCGSQQHMRCGRIWCNMIGSAQHGSAKLQPGGSCTQVYTFVCMCVSLVMQVEFLASYGRFEAAGRTQISLASERGEDKCEWARELCNMQHRQTQLAMRNHAYSQANKQLYSPSLLPICTVHRHKGKLIAIFDISVSVCFIMLCTRRCVCV